jgi:hypothetical protein
MEDNDATLNGMKLSVPVDKSRLWRPVFTAVGCVFIAASLMMLYGPRERRLLERSTKLADVTHDAEATGAEIPSNFLWISEHEVLYFRGFWAPGHLRVATYDFTTRREKPLTSLTRLFNRSFLRHTEQTVSPDGKWLLWRGEQGEIRAATLENLDALDQDDLDGTRHVNWAVPEADEIYPVCWMRDSRHLVEFTADYKSGRLTKAVIRRVDAPEESRTILIPASSLLKVDTDIGPVISENHVVAIATNEIDRDEHTITVLQTSLSAGQTRPQRYWIRVSGRSDLYDRVLAPHGDCIAWEAVEEQKDPVRTLLHRLLPFVRAEAERYSVLYVSRISGSEEHQLGYVKMEPTPDTEGPVDLKWLPDGKHLSFLYNDALWVTPIEVW